MSNSSVLNDLEPTDNSSFTRGPSPLDQCGWPMPNPTQRPQPHSIRYLDLCSYPFLLQLTTIGNILNILVLRSDKPFGSKGTYLTALAVTDLIYMWSALVSYISNYDGEIHGFPRPPVRYVVDRFNGLTIFMQETCVIASAWLIVAFTLERFLAIRYPLKHLILSHGRRSLCVVAGVIGVAAMIAIVRLVDYYWFYINFIGLEPRPLRRPIRPIALLRWYGVYVWALAIIQIGTFLTILFLNVGLLRVIVRQQRVRRDSLHAVVQNSNQDRPGGIDKGAVAMLAACSILYLVTQMPGFVGNVLYLLDKGCIKQLSAATRAVLAPLLNVLLNVNFSANFLVYCAANPNFRKGVKSLLRLADDRAARRKSIESTRSDSLVTKNSRHSVCSKLNVRMSQSGVDMFIGK